MAVRKKVYTVEVLSDDGNGTISERWLKSGKLDREHGPAYLKRDLASGTTIQEGWFKNGEPGRRDGPAQMDRDPVTGVTFLEAWYQSFTRKLDREDGPALIKRDRQTGQVTKATWFRAGRRVDVPRRVRLAYLASQKPSP
jgi:hypothetical protein